MPNFSTKRRVRHAAADMFDLVADVEKYPEFVPLCESLKVRNRADKGRDLGERVTVITAAMTVAYKLIRQTFLSRVTLDKPNMKIVVEYLDGPFSKMQNRWTFKPTGDDTCEVEFFIDYEFRSRTFGMLMGAVFDTVFRKMASAFEERADKVYGRKAAPNA